MLPGVGFKLTDDGNNDIDAKRLTDVSQPVDGRDAATKAYVDWHKLDVILRDGSQNMTGNLDMNNNKITSLADSTDDNDAVSSKVLKEHIQFHQNNYHLQPSFKIYKDFGDKSQLTVGSPPNTPSNHFFQNHKAHHDAYIIEKEGYDTGFSGQAWSSMKMKGNQLENGTYTAIFEIFVIGDAGNFLVDDTIIYQVHGDSHHTINTFDSDKINSQYTKSIIQFTTDGGAGVDDGIKFQIKYFGSQYNKNIKFLFYSRVIKGTQSTSFNHNIFNVSDVDDNHKILYFENLNLNGNLIDGLGDPVDDADAVNKKYVDGENTKQNIAINHNSQTIGNSLLHLNGSKKMVGNLDMDEHHIFSVKNLTDHKVDDAYGDIVKDLKSVVNKEYLNENFLKIKGNYCDLNQRVIKNSAPHDDGSYDNNTLVSKAFVDAEIAKIPKAATDVLKLDGSKAMTGALDMNNNEIKNLKDPVNDQDAAIKKWINTQLGTKASLTYTNTQLAKKLDLSGANMTGDINLANSHKIINSPNPTSDTDLVTKKYMETHVNRSSITNSNKSNAFQYVMDKPQNHLTEEDDIQFGNMVTLNSSPHSINKNVIDTKLKFDADHGDYSSRLGINVFVLPLGSYTMAFDLIWTSNSVDTNSMTLGYAVDNVTVHNMSYKVSGKYARMIIQFSKYGNSDPDHIYVDILIKMKTGSLFPLILQTFMVCYGIKGLHTDIPLSVYDAIWGFDNGKVTFNETIDMNQKDITGVNKITTGYLDVNGQIDVKGNKIIGVGNGTDNSDAVNKKQFDDLETQINSEVATVDNKIIQIRNDINDNLNSLTKLKYFLFTNKLKHDNEKNVRFPPKKIMMVQILGNLH